MRILHIAPMIAPITERPPGGAEKLAVDLAQHQARVRGDSVAIIAASGSRPPPEPSFVDVGVLPNLILPVEIAAGSGEIPVAAAEVERRIEIERQAFQPVRAHLETHRDRFDIVHNHAFDSVPLFDFNALGIPTVHTLHLPPIAGWINRRLAAEAGRYPHVRYVTVSRSCAGRYREAIGFAPAVIYNGIDINAVPYRESPERHFLYVGRISPEKGLRAAIDCVVKRCRQKLTVIGRVYDEDYFERTLAPYLDDPLLEYLGHLPHAEVIRQMGRARALVLPIAWDEPFGLVFIEALAAGTPVITSRRGAAVEIIEDGRTGILVGEDRELGAALDAVAKIDRARCRESVAARFALSSTAAAYARVYGEVLAAARKP